MDENRFEIHEEELAVLKELVGITGKKFEGFDDLGFLKDLPITAYQLPERMIKFLNEFKYNPPKEGYCIVSTGMVNAQALGATPSHWDLKTNNATCKKACTPRNL